MTSSQQKRVPPIVFIAIGLGVIGIWQFLIKTHSNSTSTDLINSVSNVPSGNFREGGSTTWAPVRKDVDPTIQFSFPNFKLAYVNPESGNPSTSKGIEMLIDGKLDFVQASKEIPNDLLKRAEQKGIRLKQMPIAIDAIAVAVHPSLNISGLTLDSIERIRSGKITNWRELGGQDLPIHIYAVSSEDVNGATFIKTENSTDTFRKLSIDPGGIHWGSSGALTVPQCGIKTLPIGTENRLVAPYQLPAIAPANCSAKNHNQLNPDVFQSGAYPLLRKLSVVVVEDGSLRQQAGEAYVKMLLTSQGQSLLRQAGYLNLQTINK
jgi:phosphate transport system substrate-binding protein